MHRWLPALALLALFVSSLLASTPEESLKLGRDACEKRNFAAAIVHLQDCLDAGAQGDLRDECLNTLADAYSGNKDFNKQMATLELLISAGNSERVRSQALFRKAGAYMGHGDEMLGQSTYAQFVREYPESESAPAALMFQANYAVLEKGDQAKAIQLFEEIVQRFSDSKEAELATVYLPGIRNLKSEEFKKQVEEYQHAKAEAKKAKAEK